jgi:uncharacterized protein
MNLLDTNVLMYARGKEHPFKEACTEVLRQAELDPTAYGIDVEMLQELLDVYERRGEPAFAVRLVEETLVGFPDPFPITRREIEEAADIVKGHRGLSPRDALHAAVVLTYGLEGIVSTDRAFDRIPGVVRRDPVKLARR